MGIPRTTAPWLQAANLPMEPAVIAQLLLEHQEEEYQEPARMANVDLALVLVPQMNAAP